MTSHPQPPASAKAVAHLLQETLGGTCHVTEFRDEHEAHAAAVLSSTGAADGTPLTFSTVDLHLAPNPMDGNDIRVELMMQARAADDQMANVVATGAFFVMKEHLLAAPGVVFPNLVSEYFPDTTTPHVMWVHPVMPELTTAAIEGAGDVHWLRGIPISESEQEFLGDAGFDALEALLAANGGVDVTDLHRASVV